MSKTTADLQIEIPLDLVKELLTDSELIMVKRRLLILKMLSQGMTVRQISKKVKVGTDTVIRISKKYKKSLFLRKFFSKDSPAVLPKWVFGEISIKE